MEVKRVQCCFFKITKTRQICYFLSELTLQLSLWFALINLSICQNDQLGVYATWHYLAIYHGLMGSSLFASLHPFIPFSTAQFALHSTSFAVTAFLNIHPCIFPIYHIFSSPISWDNVYDVSMLNSQIKLLNTSRDLLPPQKHLRSFTFFGSVIYHSQTHKSYFSCRGRTFPSRIILRGSVSPAVSLSLQSVKWWRDGVRSHTYRSSYSLHTESITVH